MHARHLPFLQTGFDMSSRVISEHGQSDKDARILPTPRLPLAWIINIWAHSMSRVVVVVVVDIDAQAARNSTASNTW